MGKRYVTECNGQQVLLAYNDTGHGDSFVVKFDRGMELYIWAFDSPDQIQSVLWDLTTNTIIKDNRSEACKAACAKYEDADSPFRIVHRQ